MGSVSLVHVLMGVAIIAFAGWAGLVGTVARATRTPPITGIPISGGVEPGPQSPALVDLITGGWRVDDREAAAATLLDLAARGYLQIEDTGAEMSVVRVRAEGHDDGAGDGGPDTAEAGTGRAGGAAGRLGDLTPYERMVYDHVRSLAGDGAVPTEALSEGSRDLRRWWRRFQRHVVDEAKAQGLSRSRWSKRQSRLLWAGALVPAAAVAAIFVFAPAAGPEPANGLAPGLVTWIVLMSGLRLFNAEQGTPEGARAAGQWLEWRRHLVDGGEFADTPAAGVAVWGRRLAYAVALGLAGHAAASLPVSRPADDGKAWSDHGGTWHVVRVRYPGIGLPAGHRLRALRGRGRLAMVVAALVAAILAYAATTALLVALDPDALYTGLDPAGTRGDAGRNLAIALVVAGLAGAAPLILGIVDHFSPQMVEGQVIRLRRYENVASRHRPSYSWWVAVDEGSGGIVTAYAIDAAGYAELTEGDVVRLRAGRLLRTVDGVTVLRPSKHRAEPVEDTSATRP